MKKSRNGQSLGSQAVDELPPEEVAKWLQKDIGVALSLLNALYQDEDLRLMMARFLQGRYVNAKNAERLESESDAGPN